MDNFESSSSLLFLFFTLKKSKTATMEQQLEDSLARNLMLRTNLLVRFYLSILDDIHLYSSHNVGELDFLVLGI